MQALDDSGGYDTSMDPGDSVALQKTHRGRWRMPIAGVVVFGFGGLVAIAVGLVLYLGLYTATENTSRLIKARSVTLIDILERRIEALLDPVVDQSTWIADQLQRNTFGPGDLKTLDAFMFGALAATPQVAGIGWISPDGQVRLWSRNDETGVVEDWSTRADIVEWLAEGRARIGPGWNIPIWTHTIQHTVLLHDAPLWRDGEFLGMLAQIVPVADLSRDLENIQTESGMVPFVLYDRDRVLAHPRLIVWEPVVIDRESPLAQINELGDAVLARIWDTNEVPFLLRGMKGVEGAGVMVNGAYYVFLHKDVERYGPRVWTVGVYFDTEKIGGEEPRRIRIAFGIGLAALVLAVALAALAGRRFSVPIATMAKTADVVGTGRVEDVPALPSSRVRELDAALRSFEQMVDGLRDRQIIRDTLGRFVPQEVAKTLLAGGGTLKAEEAEATLLFCDLEDFTSLTERIGPTGVFDLLNEYFEAMVAILERYGGIVTQFQGDAILATFNVPVANQNHAADALRAAIDIQAAVKKRRFAGERLHCRIGINTGRIVAGAVGAKGRLSYTVHGDAVNLAARLESLNKQYGTRVLVSEATASRVNGFDLEPVGETTVRGHTQPVRLFALST